VTALKAFKGEKPFALLFWWRAAFRQEVLAAGIRNYGAFLEI
jgi:hypothetical protein